MTGSGSAKWTVEADPSAPTMPNVLKQSGTGAFLWCVKTEPAIATGYVDVKFKPIAGNEDQAAGVIWRFQDANNYYLARANALENNVVPYKVQDGKRQALDIVGRNDGYGVNVKIATDRWSVLTVEFLRPTLFTVLLDGQQLFQVEDSTFTKAGLVGLWTKADSVTLFDDFDYGATSPAALRAPDT